MRVQQAQYIARELKREQLAFTAGHRDVDGIGQPQARTRARRLARLHMGQRRALAGDAFHQYLDPAPTFLAATQPCLDDTGIVEYQQVAAAQQSGKLSELPVVQAAMRVDMQKPAAAALRGGSLGDEFGWQLVVELRKLKIRDHG